MSAMASKLANDACLKVRTASAVRFSSSTVGRAEVNIPRCRRGVRVTTKASTTTWPLHSPNPNAHDMAATRRLTAVSRQLVGLGAVAAAA